MTPTPCPSCEEAAQRLDGYSAMCAEQSDRAEAAEARALAAESALAEVTTELARWKKSFVGHVYVKNEDYSALVEARDAALARVAALEGALRAIKRESDALHKAHVSPGGTPYFVSDELDDAIEDAARALLPGGGR